MLKNDLKANNFPHLIAKARFHSIYFFENKKIFHAVLSNFFSTPRSSLELIVIMQFDTWQTNLFAFQI